MKTFSLLFLLFTQQAYAFSCHEPQVIHQKPIQFDQKRIKLTREYQLSHYGIDSKLIEPKMVVLHWTCIASLQTTFRVFNSATLPVDSARRQILPGDLNVSSHYLVDRDGTISSINAR